MQSFKKLMSDYGLGVIIILLLLAYAISSFSDYFTDKHLGGSEGNAPIGGMAGAYNDSAATSNEVLGGNDGDFAPAIPSAQVPSQTVQNPADLLPKGVSDSDFAAMSPAAANVNNDALLNAGYHMGIGGSDAPLRNANLQLRSEEANPRQDTGPWNQSTIEGDSMRKGLGIC